MSVNGIGPPGKRMVAGLQELSGVRCPVLPCYPVSRPVSCPVVNERQWTLLD